jgi:hypothetical protein
MRLSADYSGFWILTPEFRSYSSFILALLARPIFLPVSLTLEHDGY